MLTDFLNSSEYQELISNFKEYDLKFHKENKTYEEKYFYYLDLEHDYIID